MPIEIGSAIRSYLIEAEIGRGGMGVVYRAEQPSLARPVALKVITPELAGQPGFRERFERESRLAAAIEHPNVLPVYEAGEAEGGILFLAMRYIEGTDLSALIRDHGRLDPARAARIVDQLAGALDAAHARGLVHRDVKPANVLIATTGGTDHAYLADFGLTKQTAATGGLTGTGQWVGTVNYAAPEQVQGQPVDARADVYALGCVLFEALTGRLPYPRDSDVAKLFAHVNDPPPAPSPLVPELPHEFDTVIARALAKDPEDRYPSAGDLGRAAIAAARGEGITKAERTVAAGAAAPGAPETVAAPPAGPTEVAPTEPAPTKPVPAPAQHPRQHHPPRRGRGPAALLGGATALAAILVGGAFALGVIDGGESDPPGEGAGDVIASQGSAGFRTLRTESFTAEVPDGWTEVATEQPGGTRGNLNTDLRTDGIRLGINRRPGQDRDSQVSEAQERLPTDFEQIRAPSPVAVGDKDAVLWEFRLTDRDFGSNSQAVVYFFDAGGSNYRIQATWSRSEGDAELAREAARRATATLTAR